MVRSLNWHVLNFRLKTLRLDRNRLSNYNGEFFVNMGNDTDLHTLDLSYNELNYLYDGAFDYLPNLKNLDFSHNKFTFFPTDSVRSLGQLEGLDLALKDPTVCHQRPNSLPPDPTFCHQRLRILRPET